MTYNYQTGTRYNKLMKARWVFVLVADIFIALLVIKLMFYL